MTVEETAETLACEVSTIRKWLAQGRLERVKVGRLTRLRARDVADVVANGLPEARRSHGSRRQQDRHSRPENALA